jgi:hypothetical protein
MLTAKAAPRPTASRHAADRQAADHAALRRHALELLAGGHAHVTFDAALAGLPAELRNRTPKSVPHSAWRLVEHMRLAQADILEFSVNPSYVAPPFPEGYWPKEEATDASWRKSVRQFRQDLEAMKKLVANPATDLFARIPWGEGQTILREALAAADHNAYHIGEIVILRRILGAWKR